MRTGPYTREEDKRLSALRESGLTYEEIAVQLDRGGRSVIGRAFRLKLPPGRARSATKRAVTKAPARLRTCQWIDGDVLRMADSDGNVPMCGKPTVSDGSPYCQEHHARAYVSKAHAESG